MQGIGTTLARQLASGVLAGALSLGPLQSQELPTDQQLQTAFGSVYNHLGLIEYCMNKGFATAVDVANTRKSVDATIAGMAVSPSALAQQAVGRQGDIVGPQIIGLMDSSNPARPEEVREGQTMSLFDNARAQQSSERILCRQMAEQASAVVEAASRAVSDNAKGFSKPPRSVRAAIQITDALQVGVRFRQAFQFSGSRDDAREDRVGGGRVRPEKLQGPGEMPCADVAAVAAALALAPNLAPSSPAVAFQDGLEGTDRSIGTNIGNRT